MEVKTHSVIGGEEFWKDTRQQLDFTRCTDKRVVNVATGIDVIFDALEQERVLTDLPQLHQLVAQTLDTTRFPMIARLSLNARDEKMR